MKIGIIGLGDIAQKAYLPVLSEKEGIELALCMRNSETLNKLAAKYRIQEKISNCKRINHKIDDSLITHAICEKIVTSIEESKLYN